MVHEERGQLVFQNATLLIDQVQKALRPGFELGAFFLCLTDLLELDFRLVDL